MRLFRSTAIIGSLTLVSRLLGLVRDILIARVSKKTARRQRIALHQKSAQCFW